MILLDKPYISAFLIETIRKNGFPVIRNDFSESLNLPEDIVQISSDEAVRLFKTADRPRMYTASENSIGWIAEHLSFSSLPDDIEKFKNKGAFRRMLEPIYPDFHYQVFHVDELGSVVADSIPFPVILKPTIGFFSMGVYLVERPQDWSQAVQNIQLEMEAKGNLYPAEVLNTTTFIVEEIIEGDEFAVDAYFDEQGEPVVLNILQHLFASADDVSDRVYLTSRAIIENNLKRFTDFLKEVGELADVRNFPVHVEIRVDGKGKIQPIEINPMRFGGWCTTADATWHAYGFNSYEHYFQNLKPDWESVLRLRGEELFALIVLDNSTGVDGRRIASFDYEALLSRFEKPLELRKIDFVEYPVFGFLFTESRNLEELNQILVSDLQEFITRIQAI